MLPYDVIRASPFKKMRGEGLEKFEDFVSDFFRYPKNFQPPTFQFF